MAWGVMPKREAVSRSMTILACGAVASDYAANLLDFVARYGFVEPRTTALGFAAATSFDDIVRAHIEDELGGRIAV